MKRLYQNIEIPGMNLPYESRRRKNSGFWNEGKWNNFINPLLPRYCRNKTFIEIGSSAGLFLKMAENRGFKHVIGIESHPARIKEAELYRKSTNSHYRLIHEKISQSFNFDKLPLAHVILFSNIHYYLSIPNFSRIVDAFRTRCVYCIVVAARVKIRSGMARYDLGSVRGYFNDWKEIKVISHLKTEGDPSPRPGMYGVLFKGALEEYGTKQLYDQSLGKTVKSSRWKQSALPSALNEFYGRVFSGKEFDMKKTAYYKYWTIRRPDRPEGWILRKLRRKARLGRHIRDNGMLSPIYIKRRGLFDGQHRLVITRRLGHKRVLVRPYVKKCRCCGAIL